MATDGALWHIPALGSERQAKSVCPSGGAALKIVGSCHIDALAMARGDSYKLLLLFHFTEVDRVG